MRQLLPCFAILMLAACDSAATDGDSTTGSEGGGNSSKDTSTSTSVSQGGGDVAGTDATVVAFDKEPIYFAGEDNRRIVDKTVTLPADGLYSNIALELSLECPSGGCDFWDRLGSFQLVLEEGEGDAPDTVIELSRFVTPYRVGFPWTVDLTSLRPVLAGEVKLRAFIDTWVGPGSPYGDGWLLNAKLVMTGGIPEKIPVSVEPVWTTTAVVYGDPAKPIATSAPMKTIAVSSTDKAVELRAFVTGHGQGNAGNCAEFCEKDHTLIVDGMPHTRTMWRDDCATTGAPGQQGTWKYPRAGWCPGAEVHPWVVDITSELAGKDSVEIGYDVEGYENTCRPDAETCTGCTLGASCDYDGGTHTEPNYQVSAALIRYR